MANLKILIVEDDLWYGELLKYHLSLNPDFEVILVQSGKDCVKKLVDNPDIVCIDYGLPDMGGDNLLQYIQSHNRDIPVIIISGQEEISVAVDLLKAGARDYIVKGDNTKELLWQSILNIRETVNLKREVQDLRKKLHSKYEFQNPLLGNSPQIKGIFHLIEKAIRTNINVSITGETGTGKELVANAIHFNSDRKHKPFVAVNMAAIPKELIESELFGHEKGAFTGAVTRKLGKFEEAQGGSIFLDEIGELDINMQSKILRVLQERELVRIGSNEKIKLDVRIISATHKDLSHEVEEGNFREDLFFRLIGLPIQLDPLRNRKEDILILAKHFLKEFSNENGLSFTSFSDKAREKLLTYEYPGNVRELKAVVELAAVLANDTLIGEQDIQFTSLKRKLPYSTDEKSLREYTREIIKSFMDRYDNNVLEVARKLDIGKSTIYKMIQDQEILV
ncbi:MAG: sigma-54-dependent Fis family transcriptional regulator [Saprospiraceae bacterium]|nr:sigma-54-dependent Fis family transcriptional regulator [Saprospiraceae bacterium]